MGLQGSLWYALHKMFLRSVSFFCPPHLFSFCTIHMYVRLGCHTSQIEKFNFVVLPKKTKKNSRNFQEEIHWIQTKNTSNCPQIFVSENILKGFHANHVWRSSHPSLTRLRKTMFPIFMFRDVSCFRHVFTPNVLGAHKIIFKYYFMST